MWIENTLFSFFVFIQSALYGLHAACHRTAECLLSAERSLCRRPDGGLACNSHFVRDVQVLPPLIRWHYAFAPGIMNLVFASRLADKPDGEGKDWLGLINFSSCAGGCHLYL